MVVGREEERELELIFVGFERNNAGFWVCPVSERERQELGKRKKILILGRLGR